MSNAKAGTAKKSTSRVSSAERRDSILAAATQVFIRSGYAGARTKDIAVEANINEALIYRHFASKEELFDAAVIEPLERWIETYPHAGALIAEATGSDTQLELMERTAEQYVAQVSAVLPLLGIALFGSEEHGAEFYTKRLMPLIANWATRTKAAMPNDARGAALDPRFLACAGIGISVFLAADAHFRGVPFDAKHNGAQLSQLMLPLFEHHGKAPANTDD